MCVLSKYTIQFILPYRLVGIVREWSWLWSGLGIGLVSGFPIGSFAPPHALCRNEDTFFYSRFAVDVRFVGGDAVVPQRAVTDSDFFFREFSIDGCKRAEIVVLPVEVQMYDFPVRHEVSFFDKYMDFMAYIQNMS